MELTLLVIATFLLSAAAGWLTIPRIVMISKKKKLFDELSARKSHTGAVPRLGGVSFLPAFLFSFSLAVGLRYMLGLDVAAPHEMAIPLEFMFLVSGATVLFCVGLADDLAGVGYRIKFLAQLLSAALLLCSGVWIDNLDGLFGLHHVPTAVGALLTVLVVVLLTNAYNLIDGIDGLCSGLSILALFTFGVWFLTHHIYVYAMMSMAMAGVVTIFFFYNVMGHRMKIFMGDTGSLSIGGIIAVFALCIRKELLLPLLCGIFLVESLSVMLQVSYFKYTKRKYGEGRRILLMSPLHHHYQKQGFFETKIVTRFWIVSLLLAAITLVTLKIR